MSFLSEQLVKLRGDRTQAEFAKLTQLSLRTVAKIEAGDPYLQLDTVRRIAQSLSLPQVQWLELLVDWIRAEIGEENFRRLNLQPAEDPSKPWTARDGGDNEQLIRLFKLLSKSDQEQIIKTMQRKEVLACLSPINSTWEKFDKPS